MLVCACVPAWDVFSLSEFFLLFCAADLNRSLLSSFVLSLYCSLCVSLCFVQPLFLRALLIDLCPVQPDRSVCSFHVALL